MPEIVRQHQAMRPPRPSTCQRLAQRGAVMVANRFPGCRVVAHTSVGSNHFYATARRSRRLWVRVYNSETTRAVVVARQPQDFVCLIARESTNERWKLG
jgi:hypothetical protein